MDREAKFQARETDRGLKELDEALATLGYKKRSHWYNEMKRRTLLEAKKEREVK